MNDIEEIVKLTYIFRKLRDVDNKSFSFINSILKELTKKSGAI